MKAQKTDNTIKQCIKFFLQEANPNVLITLEESLSKPTDLEKSQKNKEEYYKYYIDNFHPALKTEVIKSEELTKPSVLNNKEKLSQRSPKIKGKILGIISGITNKGSDKNHSSSFIQNQKVIKTTKQIDKVLL